MKCFFRADFDLARFFQLKGFMRAFIKEMIAAPPQRLKRYDFFRFSNDVDDNGHAF